MAITYKRVAEGHYSAYFMDHHIGYVFRVGVNSWSYTSQKLAEPYLRSRGSAGRRLYENYIKS